jgi:hypothetical protein
MKTIKLVILVFSVITLTWLSSCKKDELTSNDNSSTITNIVTQSKWKITKYNDSGTDELYHFSGYEFSFESDGKIIATKNSTAVNGSWSEGIDDSQTKFYLDFGTTTPFDELNDDWHILEKTSVMLKLEDVSGGNGGTDLLTFEKI